MKIAIVGTGYVGLVSGTCFAEMGTEVYCVDVDTKKIEELNKGIMPIYEPGLKEMVLRNQQAGRLHFLTDLSACLNDVEVVFSAVGTPPDDDHRDQKHRAGRNSPESPASHPRGIGPPRIRPDFRCGIKSGIPERGSSRQRLLES